MTTKKTPPSSSTPADAPTPPPGGESKMLSTEGWTAAHAAFDRLDQEPDRIKETRHLQCKLSSVEIVELRERSSRELSARSRLDAEIAVLSEQLKALKKRRDGADEEAARLTRVADDGFEYRDVECVEVTDFAFWHENKLGAVLTLRRDTLDIVDRRDIPKDKRQGSLFDETSP